MKNKEVERVVLPIKSYGIVGNFVWVFVSRFKSNFCKWDEFYDLKENPE
jgi:hypothetical protein